MDGPSSRSPSSHLPARSASAAPRSSDRRILTTALCEQDAVALAIQKKGFRRSEPGRLSCEDRCQPTVARGNSACSAIVRTDHSCRDSGTVCPWSRNCRPVVAGRNPAHLPLAELWRALGDTEQAAKHAEAAYRRAWGDGDPYVRRYDLDSAKTLLQQLGQEIPALPVYDPVLRPKIPLENEIDNAITEIRKSAQSKT